MSDQEEFIGSTHDEWWKFDQQFAPGGLFAGLPPSKRAELEGNMIARIGERPAPIDPVELLHRNVEHRFDVLGAEVNPGMVAALDARLDAISDDERPARTEATIRELGMKALPELTVIGSSGQAVVKYGMEAAVMEAGRHWLEQAQDAAVRVAKPQDPNAFRRRIAADGHALRYYVSVDQQQQRRAAALAKLPARK